MKNRIVVIGSSNTDIVIKCPVLPLPGETVIGGNFFMNPGGKGANQAVAAARLGGSVTFITKTGNDSFGKENVKLYAAEGIYTDFIVTDPENPSGIAMITIDEKAENSIVVASGANGTLMPEDLSKSFSLIEDAFIVLMQLEIPLKTVEFVAEKAVAKGVKVILNPAPALALPDSLLKNLFIITPNRKEAEMLTGVEVKSIDSAKKAAKVLLNRGVKAVVITLGSEGAVVADDKDMFHVPVAPVKAVDTTAAGDVFNGALAVALTEGLGLEEAVSFACKSASISVTRLGALKSSPYRKEMDEI